MAKPDQKESGAIGPKVFIHSNQGRADSRDVDIRDRVQPASQATASGGIEVETVPVYETERLEYEHFLRDEIDIELMEPGNENEPQFVEITVNGDYRLLVRDGSTQTCRRYHLAVLAQAKQSRVRQKKIVNPDGSMGFQEETVLSQTYPFRVVQDPNPKRGGPWLRDLLRTPG